MLRKFIMFKYIQRIKGLSHQLLARMKYKSKQIFVKLFSGSNPWDSGSGCIYLHRNANLFIREIYSLSPEHMGIISQSLHEDGHFVEIQYSTYTYFKSLVPEVKSIEDVSEMVGPALSYQDLFNRSVLSREKDSWDEDELKEFHIYPERLNCVYDIKYVHNVVGFYYYYLLAHMEYNDRQVFVELDASSGAWSSKGRGTLLVRKNPNLLSKEIKSLSTEIMQRTEQSLHEDGYQFATLFR